MNNGPTPSWRKPAGMLMILGMITIWAGIIATFATEISLWPFLLQLIFYVFTGIIWIFPARPILVWMETGRWRT